MTRETGYYWVKLPNQDIEIMYYECPTPLRVRWGVEIGIHPPVWSMMCMDQQGKLVG